MIDNGITDLDQLKLGVMADSLWASSSSNSAEKTTP
jgi:hypothetical protein